MEFHGVTADLFQGNHQRDRLTTHPYHNRAVKSLHQAGTNLCVQKCFETRRTNSHWEQYHNYDVLRLPTCYSRVYFTESPCKPVLQAIGSTEAEPHNVQSVDQQTCFRRQRSKPFVLKRFAECRAVQYGDITMPAADVGRRPYITYCSESSLFYEALNTKSEASRQR